VPRSASSSCVRARLGDYGDGYWMAKEAKLSAHDNHVPFPPSFCHLRCRCMVYCMDNVNGKMKCKTAGCYTFMTRFADCADDGGGNKMCVFSMSSSHATSCTSVSSGKYLDTSRWSRCVQHSYADHATPLKSNWLIQGRLSAEMARFY
jgi:hypothetical protein